MPLISYTEQQREAIRTTGQSVVVSAAAGSGKTAVLAQRCAYLVSEASASDRCNVDELLVLTFTDAAAAEMRTRIVDALRARLIDRAHDQRLRDQVALVESAQISTVHSFCLWLIRRWFTRLEIDPAATVLSAEESALIRREVLGQLFSRLYDHGRAPSNPLGNVEEVHPGAPGKANAAPGMELADAFRRLVDDYGLGDDRGVCDTVLRLYEFTQSLPDPDRWLASARASLSMNRECLAQTMLEELADELLRQVEHVEQIATGIEAGDPVGHFYADKLRAYARQLRAWREVPGERGTIASKESASDPADAKEQDDPASFESLRAAIKDYQFDSERAPRLSRDVDAAVRAARDAASDQLKDVKQRLFAKRLRQRLTLYSLDELQTGLSRTAPYVATIAQLVLAFRDAYSARKRELNVMDFADLERFAFQLLCDESDGVQPSEIARALHDRFKYVLVDEFQDINPLQQAIIKLASRESDAERDDNLFAVGDVKQSIYRFRLAEPSIFSDRAARFRDPAADGRTIFLQRNFRSRPEILEAVNVVFGALLREGYSGIAYDEEARLRPGRDDISGSSSPVEVHLLERQRNEADDEDDDEGEHGVTEFDRPERWSVIEREAYVIGERIRRLVRSDGAESGPAVRYGDVAVLLRAAKINAERIAAMLTAMGMPAYADAGGSLFAAREIRDAMAGLHVLDNPMQDIPLAAVLRSGLFGERLTDNELAVIRCASRDVPFHVAVRRFAAEGEDADLRSRLEVVLRRIESHREAVRCRPLADVLWRVYHWYGFLAYVGGLPVGAQRRANLLKLHELARQFGSFRRQGLHRFLRFVESLEDDERGVAAAPAIGESENVVRIMSIHQAKGLEFPVVFVAGLGTRFNLGDRNSRMIFERTMGIGLRVVDAERMIEYPSIAHTRVAEEIERTARQEEMRILYVAMTRARDKLVLVGSARSVQRFEDLGSMQGAKPPPTGLDLEAATTPLGWLVPVLRSVRPGVCGMAVEVAGKDALFSVTLHGVEDMRAWSTTRRRRATHEAVQAAVANGRPLPANEPLAREDSIVNDVVARVDYEYPYLASASIKASLAASESARAMDFARNPDEQYHRRRPDEFQMPQPGLIAETDDAARRGTATHRVLQHLDYALVVNADGVAREVDRIVRAGLITEEEAALVDQDSIAWFGSTPLADAIRNAGKQFRREFLFTAAAPLESMEQTIDLPSGDHILVRGMVDGILPVSDGIEIIDFKTDALARDEVAERADRYRPQIDTYARSMARLWRKPVRACWLVFLTPRKCFNWRDGAWEG